MSPARAGALAALGAVAAQLGAGILVNVADGIPSPYDTPAAEVAEFLAMHSTSMLASGFLEALAGVLLAGFGAVLALRLSDGAPPRPAAILGLTGAGIYAALLVVVGAMLFAAANLAGRGEAAAQAVVGLTVLWNTTVIMLGPAAALFLAGFGLAGLRVPDFPNWVGWLGVTGAVLGMLAPLPDIVAAFSFVLADLISLLATLQQAVLIVWLLATANWLR